MGTLRPDIEKGHNPIMKNKSTAGLSAQEEAHAERQEEYASGFDRLVIPEGEEAEFRRQCI